MSTTLLGHDKQCASVGFLAISAMHSVATIVFVILSTLSFSEGYVTCYYGSWATYRSSNGHFTVEDIDPFLCDEIIYCFAGLNETSSEIMVLDPYNDLYDDIGDGGFDRFINLKSKNPALKTTLSVGGWNEGGKRFSAMAADTQRTSAFVTSAVKLLMAHQFDGLDVDWEYPTRDGAPEDKDNFVTLLQELKTALDAQGLSLTVAVSAAIQVIDAAYDVPAIDKIVDRIHVLTYDFHGEWEGFTHHHSPLYAHPLDSAGNATMNVDHAVSYLLGVGATPGKLMMGIPTFARCYTLETELNTDFYAPAPAPGIPAPYTDEAGILGYNEICEFQSITDGWVTKVDPSMNEPYTYRLANMIWCGFENPESAAIKAAYARERKLGGIVIYSLETDDFHGLCENSRPYALVNSMKESFAGTVSKK